MSIGLKTECSLCSGSDHVADKCPRLDASALGKWVFFSLILFWFCLRVLFQFFVFLLPVYFFE